MILLYYSHTWLSWAKRLPFNSFSQRGAAHKDKAAISSVAATRAPSSAALADRSLPSAAASPLLAQHQLHPHPVPSEWAYTARC